MTYDTNNWCDTYRDGEMIAMSRLLGGLRWLGWGGWVDVLVLCVKQRASRTLASREWGCCWGWRYLTSQRSTIWRTGRSPSSLVLTETSMMGILYFSAETGKFNLRLDTILRLCQNLLGEMFINRKDHFSETNLRESNLYGQQNSCWLVKFPTKTVID